MCHLITKPAGPMLIIAQLPKYMACQGGGVVPYYGTRERYGRSGLGGGGRRFWNALPSLPSEMRPGPGPGILGPWNLSRQEILND